MTTVDHIIAGWLQAKPNPRICCHCLLLRDPRGIALIETGIGLEDVRDPVTRVGEAAIRQAGFEFDEEVTMRRQLERRGIAAESVTDIIVTHLDPDHAGGLADFPWARVHVSVEERAAALRGDHRYRPVQWSHGVKWVEHGVSSESWFGIEARPLDLGFASKVLLIPLFGHTIGHCGVAIEREGGWLLHIGDAYYLRGELTDPDHPVGPISAAVSADNTKRLASLETLRTLAREQAHPVTMFGYHDVSELP